MELERPAIYPHNSFSLREHYVFTLLVLYIALDFFDNVSSTFGTSDDDPMPPIESDSVIIPETRFSLQPALFEELKRTIDPLQQSENYGIDIFI